MVPSERIRALNDRPIDPHGRYVLHWMIGYRRTGWNFALQRAVELSTELDRPLVVLEALRVGYRWASDRLHRFILDGFEENRRRLEAAGVRCVNYVEPEAGHGKGLLRALAAHACAVTTDDFPTFMLPHMEAAGARQVPVRMEAIDSNGLWPMRATQRVFATAASFRLHLQKNLRAHLAEAPEADPLRGAEKLPRLHGIDAAIEKRWPPPSRELLAGELGGLPIDHRVQPVPYSGSAAAAKSVWRDFLERKLDVYPEARNHPDDDGSSGLSPWLHFGRISVHEIFADLAAREGWSLQRLGRAGGGRHGYWGMSEAAEAFLDELVVWRELGLNLCALRTGEADRYDSLPPWARATLEEHASDPREAIYTLRELEEARTHDPLWNAAQRQLLREGRIHNYLRMLWGKKILEWSPSPREALARLIELNDKWAVDGRDPNSLSGIFWVLGRYDRPWGPERPIFGKVRYMTSANTARKLHVRRYLERFGP